MGVFRFEPHTHTGETSKCGRIPARELVDLYKKMGFSGIAITDHLHESYIDYLYCFDDWNTCVDRFLDGYRRAKTRGDEVGLSVTLGMELRFLENDNDYLVYGIDEAWLRAHPYPYRMGPEAFFQTFGAELLIIHAHPFRAGNTFVRANCVHGIEVVNTHPEHPNFNERALALSKEVPTLYRLAGSDTHRKGQEGKAWVEFDRAIVSSKEYRNAIVRGGYRLGCALEDGQAVIADMETYFGK
ncbi:PHP domain-containing protein [Christensenellaceae bacterium OttesenSCG-928-L17]|nr:PHP domain-containing protein [Christensenellaceae bacterium OttesenSCG-928-L17]